MNVGIGVGVDVDVAYDSGSACSCPCGLSFIFGKVFHNYFTALECGTTNTPHPHPPPSHTEGSRVGCVGVAASHSHSKNLR